MLSKQTATIEPCGNGFAVAVGGEIIRAGFVSRGHASMWASRQHLYERKTPRRREIELPPDLGDLRIVRSTHAAKIVGSSYPRFLEESRAGLWGPRVQISGNSFGHALGDLKRGLAARTIKESAA